MAGFGVNVCVRSCTYSQLADLGLHREFGFCEMAPPRKIVRAQQEFLLDFLEANRELVNGIPPGEPRSNHPFQRKWAELARKLNAVHGGDNKTPDGWKKYLFGWRHKCRKKAADSRRYATGADSGQNRFVPLNDLEIRLLELGGTGYVAPSVNPNSSQQIDADDNNDADFLADDNSDSEQTLQELKVQALEIKPGPSATRTSRTFRSSAEDETHPSTPPPRWALELEERRIAAEERMASALESMATVMRSQEDRRVMLDERIADALTVIAGTVQDISSGLQEALQHLKPLQNGAYRMV
ncbi:hypothetical protein NE865_12724 [Phthorimaea operculella]|nr:hypothetical protein NE865_12724 [Phthorimaea operculella]